MDRTLAILAGGGWRVLEVAGDRVTLQVNPLDISRAPAALQRLFTPHGAIFHEAKPPFDRPCAWIEYDLATRGCRMHVVINDSWLRPA